MDFFSPEFWSALLSIIVIDLVLAGDNAIVIGLAARNLTIEQRKKVYVLGAIGAIVARLLLTFVVVWLLDIPGLLLFGGLLLIWIAYELLVEEEDVSSIKSARSLWAAIKTIIIADTVMGLDNVLAVAGAAHGSFLLVLLGLLISVPIMMWGSTIIIKWTERFPIIIYIGSAVLAYTAATMIVDEPFLQAFFTDNPVLKWVLIVVIIVGVLLLGWMKKNKKK